MKSKHEEDETVELRELSLDQSDVLVDDFKDLQLEVMAGSRDTTLGWNKYNIDSRKGFNEYD